MFKFLVEDVRKKTSNLCFRPGQTQTSLYKHRRWLEAGNFPLRKKRNCTIHVAKNKGADQLRSYCEADLHHCFRLCKLLVFSCNGSVFFHFSHYLHHFETHFYCMAILCFDYGLTFQSTIFQSCPGSRWVGVSNLGPLPLEPYSPPLDDSLTDQVTTNMSSLMRKPTICICENKGADQLLSNCEADQRLCFRYTDSTIPLLSESKISSL